MNLFLNIGTWLDDEVWIENDLVMVSLFGTYDDEPKQLVVAVGRLNNGDPHKEWYQI